VSDGADIVAPKPSSPSSPASPAESGDFVFEADDFEVDEDSGPGKPSPSPPPKASKSPPGQVRKPFDDLSDGDIAIDFGSSDGKKPAPRPAAPAVGKGLDAIADEFSIEDEEVNIDGGSSDGHPIIPKAKPGDDEEVVVDLDLDFSD
jgi:hypothetical protein